MLTPQQHSLAKHTFGYCEPLLALIKLTPCSLLPVCYYALTCCSMAQLVLLRSLYYMAPAAWFVTYSRLCKLHFAAPFDMISIPTCPRPSPAHTVIRARPRLMQQSKEHVSPAGV